MAEIRVERKHNNLWVWVLGLILLALLVWGLAEALDRDRLQVDGGTAEVRTLEAPQPPFKGPVA
ncbi:MAG TPA: hypothetical protein VHN15_04625 [Thermoanaerobaculia bacterium]|nr:hypothetical protein [Thermoanaerobaculia bacterium]